MAALLLELRSQRNRREQVTRRLFRDRSNPLDFLNDQAIINNYRLDRESILHLCQDFQQQLERPTKRTRPLPVSLQVMIALRYYASGSYFNVIGDAHGVSKMAVSRCVNKVTGCITRNVTKYIEFPMTSTDQQSIQYDFYNIKEFPLVLGAVGGCLIRIKAPSIDEPLYVCRKGYHALNVQCVCDANNLFLDIVAKWPGSSHDSHVWNNCKLSEAFETGVMKNGWLLGDSGYGLKPWLLTPVLSPSTRQERKYNIAHRSTRCVIERIFGIWKMRFRCLYKGLTLTPKRNIDIIVATAALHNICMRKKIPLEEFVLEEEPEEFDVIDVVMDSDDGRLLRSRLIEDVFA